jgi:hypothetical protein
MSLCGQFAQRHFGTLHGFTLRAEGGIAQTGASVFTEISPLARSNTRAAITEAV